MNLRVSSLLILALISVGCSSEPTTLREQAEVAQEELAETRQDATEIIADSEADAVDIIADARQEAEQEVREARREADAMVDQAKQKLDTKLNALQSTDSITEEQTIPSDDRVNDGT